MDDLICFFEFDQESDKFSDDLRISAQVWRNKKERAKALRLKKYVDNLHEILGLPKKVEVRVCHLRPDPGMKVMYGQAWSSGRHLEVDIRGRFDLIVRSLAHEMVHCRQYQTGKLKFDGEDDIWEGKVYKPQRKFRSSYSAYRNQPWEKEAYSMEKPLYNMLKALD